MLEELETPLSLSKFNQHEDNVHENHKLCKEFFADITSLSFKLSSVVFILIPSSFMICIIQIRIMKIYDY